jgi:hypothetical protein
MMKEAPVSLDWVDVRAKCSLPAVFLTLKNEVEKDLQSHNALDGHKRLDFQDNGDNFSVYRTSSSGIESVAFVLLRDRIQVRDTKGTPIFDATLTLNDLGECKLKIDSAERELWQVRRRALEQFFFGPFK